MFLTPEELLAGRELQFEVEIPHELLQPTLEARPAATTPSPGRVKLRPLTVRDVQMIAKAAKTDEVFTSVLMIQKAMVEPALKPNQISEMPSGLVRYLVGCVNRISGLTTTDDQLRELRESPIGQAFFVLAQEFNWTPDQVKALTLGQILSYLEMVNQSRRAAAPR